MSSLTIYSPSGAVNDLPALRRAEKRLTQLGFAVQLDEAVRLRSQRFAGSDEQRLAALHRVADSGCQVALAARGGYGLTRLLDGIDWARIAASVQRGTRWVGQSDLTALQLGLMAHAKGAGPTWAGPLACADFGAAEVDEVTEGCFLEAVHGELEAIGFREQGAARGTQPHHGLHVSGRLWGGNLTVLLSLLGTPHFPKVRGGILFLEDVGEHPYRIERMLLQLHQAGVLGAQKAVLIGEFSAYRRTPHDRGYDLKDALTALRQRCEVPILRGLPHGHGVTKVCLPVGAPAELAVEGRDVLLAWGHA